MYLDIYYIILVMPAVFLSMYAQFKVNSTFNKYSQVLSRRGLSASDVAKMILQRNGLDYISVEHVSGKLSDHYDPKAKVVRLSDSVYNSTSIASIGVAAHECGHAIQHATSYSPLSIRNSIYPVVNISSNLSMPLILLGFIFGAANLVEFGIILFAAVVLFQIITLPVEFNASRRALAILDENGILMGDELKSTKKVLSAAALTYVAAAIVAVANLLRLILVFRDRD
jgi:Zn-dependent membrane protease YugP